MRIAVVGSGIAGLTCAYLLALVHDVTLFEKDDRLGGHTNTVMVHHEGRSLSVDTGFIVFNLRNYPNFSRLLARLGVRSRPTTMSFSVRDEDDGFEYGGSSLAGVLGSVTNLLRPRWWSVVRGVSRLRSSGRAALQELREGATIADLCASAPALILFFVLKVTGIPPTEARALRSRPEAYRRYQETTSAFFPWVPRSSPVESSPETHV